MKNRLYVALLAGLVLGIAQADDILVSQVGDKDGFGIGIVCGESFPDFNLFVPDVSDPYGTDQMLVASSYIGDLPHPKVEDGIYPPPALIHDFDIPAYAEIISATVALCTADVDDAAVSYVDDQLFLDDVEVPGAFDDVDQYAGGAAGLSGLVTFDLDPSFFPYLMDGRLEVLVDETGRITSEPTMAEGFAIDFSELTIVYSTPPIISCFGFDPPMENHPVKANKARSFPLKMQLFDADGFEVTDTNAAAPPLVEVRYIAAGSDEVVDVTDELLSVGLGTEGNQFIYIAEENMWKFNLRSNNYSGSGVYEITAISGAPDEYVLDPSCVTSFEVR